MLAVGVFAVGLRMLAHAGHGFRWELEAKVSAKLAHLVGDRLGFFDPAARKHDLGTLLRET